MTRALSRPLFAVFTLSAVWSAACGTDPLDGDPRLSAVAQAVTLTQVSSFGSNPGALQMFEFVPANLPTGAPLVVVMHGCTESASVISTETEWGNLANRFGFAVVFPQQSSNNNIESCFDWFQAGDIARDQGEALSIKQMVDTMKSTVGSDPKRVFVTGMSAGGYMTTVMMGAYPDVFAAGAVNSGGPYACATSLTATTSCENGSINNTPQQWGDLVRNAFPGYTGPYPRLVAFQGASDTTVSPTNLQWNLDQWSNLLGIDETPEVNETFRTSTHKVYDDASGHPMIETFLISGMGHALTVDPGTNVDQGGATGAFSENHSIYSSYYAAQFFGLTGTTVGGGGGSGSGSGSGSGGGSGSGSGSGSGGGSGSGSGSGGGSGSGTTGGALLETFSSAAGPDNPGWTLGGWTLQAKDATGVAGSRSIGATAAPKFNTVTQTATWANLAIGTAAKLSYDRTLSLSDANISASAGFSVIINDGADHVVDSKSISGFTSYTESSFTSHTGIDLSAFAGKTVSLKLVVTASDLSSTVTAASATVDQIQIQ